MNSPSTKTSLDLFAQSIHSAIALNREGLSGSSQAMGSSTKAPKLRPLAVKEGNDESLASTSAGARTLRNQRSMTALGGEGEGSYPYKRRPSFQPTPELEKYHVERLQKFQVPRISTKLYNAIVGQRVDTEGDITVSDPMADLAKATTLSDENYMRVRKIFSQIDSDNGGVISLREILSFRANHPKMVPPRVFSHLSLQSGSLSDGKIYLDELIMAYLPLVPRSKVEDAMDRLEARLDQSTTSLNTDSKLQLRLSWEKAFGPKVTSVSLEKFATRSAIHPITPAEIAVFVKKGFGEHITHVTFDIYVQLMKDYFTHVQNNKGSGIFAGLSLLKISSVSWASLFPFTGDISNYFDESRLIKGGAARKEDLDGWVGYTPAPITISRRGNMPRSALTPAGTRKVVTK